MEIVQIGQAKAHLSGLLARVEAGEEIIIARRGKAVARLVPEPSNSKFKNIFHAIQCVANLQ